MQIELTEQEAIQIGAALFAVAVMYENISEEHEKYTALHDNFWAKVTAEVSA